MQDFVSQIRNLAFGENTLALRLVNASLREALPDLRAGYANRIRCACGARSAVQRKGWRLQKEQARDCVPVLFELTKKMPLSFQLNNVFFIYNLRFVALLRHTILIFRKIPSSVKDQWQNLQHYYTRLCLRFCHL